MKTLYDALENYSKELSRADYAQLRTALVRYVVPGWGGPKPAGARMSGEELEAGVRYIQKVPLEQLRTALETQARVFEELGTPKSSRRNYRYQLKRFIEWAKEQNCLRDDEESVSQESLSAVRFRDSNHPTETPLEYRIRMGVNRTVGDKLMLRQLGEELQRQLKGYEKFRLTQVRAITASNDLRVLKRYLGWLTKDKGIDESAITLDDAFPFVKLRYSEDDFLNDSDPFLQAAIAEKKAFKKADASAQQVVEEVERYRSIGSKLSNRSAARIIASFMNYVKWRYRHETSSRFTDIPLYARLSELKNAYAKAGKNEPSIVPYALKSAHWSELPEVLHRLKLEADAHKFDDGGPRPQQSIARSIQRLLIISLFVAIPPRRSRVIAELELGRTFQRGKVDPQAGYIPESLLATSEDVRWCITLGPEDYKTGKSYGSQSFEINDMKFNDGTSLYRYIDQWINEYRLLFKPSHQRLFLSLHARGEAACGRPISATSVYATVTNTTLRILGKPIAPKEFRKMFVSYISNRTDMSEADLEAAAKAMAHSRKMQMQVYDQVTSEARLATGMSLADRLWTEVSQVSKS